MDRKRSSAVKWRLNIFTLSRAQVSPLNGSIYRNYQGPYSIRSFLISWTSVRLWRKGTSFLLLSCLFFTSDHCFRIAAELPASLSNSPRIIHITRLIYNGRVSTTYKNTTGGPVKPIVSLISLVLVAMLRVEWSEIDTRWGTRRRIFSDRNYI